MRWQKLPQIFKMSTPNGALREEERKLFGLLQLACALYWYRRLIVATTDSSLQQHFSIDRDEQVDRYWASDKDLNIGADMVYKAGSKKSSPERINRLLDLQEKEI